MKNQLIKEGYDILECPYCEKKCKPDAKRQNGTIVYEMHSCHPSYMLEPIKRSFEINIDGEIVE